MGPPAYQAEELDFKLDLSCLVVDGERDSETLDMVKGIDVLAGYWPSQALQQMTSLDHSQLQALKVITSRLCLFSSSLLQSDITYIACLQRPACSN